MAEVLPVGRRPRCRACDRELRPNYMEGDVTKVVPKYQLRDFRGLRQVTATDRGAQQDAKGRWYVSRPVRERIFRGTYGPYKDGLFCSLLCAYRWATGVCAALDARGERWVVHKKTESTTE